MVSENAYCCLMVLTGAFYCLKVPTDICGCLLVAEGTYCSLRVHTGAFRCLMVPTDFRVCLRLSEVAYWCNPQTQEGTSRLPQTPVGTLRYQ